MKIYSVTAEYCHGENQMGTSPEEYFFVDQTFEDEDDATAYMIAQQESGDYGDFEVKREEGEVPGWSDTGWWLTVTEQTIIPSSKKEKGKKGGKKSAANPRRNEEKNEMGRGDAALWAGLGSLAGSVASGATGIPGGSIVGGIVGGQYGAPRRSVRRSRVGGGVGGILGPLGAALGAYIGAGKPDKNVKRNPDFARRLEALTDAERAKLKQLAIKAREARTKTVAAEIRNAHKEVARLRKKEHEAAEALHQFAERLHLLETGRITQPNTSTLKRKLMGGDNR